MAKTTSLLITLLAFVLICFVPPSLHAQGAGTIINVAGGGGLASGPGLSTPLPEIGVIAADGHGNGYGVSAITCVVYRYDTSGNISVFAGNGICSAGGDGGPATQAQLQYPFSVAVDSQANVYVADLGANLVRKINIATGIISNVAGNGNPNFGGDNGPATQASLKPYSIAFDPHGNLYIGDQRNRVIRRVDAGTGTITTYAGIPGQGGYAGDGGLATAAHVGQPAALVFDAAGNLFFAEMLQCTIRRIDAATGIITRYAGNLTCGYGGDGGPALNAVLQFLNQTVRPQMAFDGSGNLLITDQANHRIRSVNTATGIITTIAGTGTPGFSGDNGPATSAQLNYPSGILVSNNQIFIADSFNNRVRRIDANQTITTFCGNGSIGDGGLATSAILSTMNGVTGDSQGRLYIGDSFANLLRKVNPAGIISTISGIPFLGGPGGDGGPAGQATLGFPSGLAFDSHGNLFIADTGNSEVREISTEGIISTYAGNAANPGNGGDGGPATQAQLSGPYGIGLDASDNLYIADGNNSNVRRVDAVTHIITTVAGNGTFGYSGDGGPATAATLGFPTNVKVDSQRNLFIADDNFAVIRRVDHATGIITTFAGNGSLPLSGDGGPATAAGIGFVWGLGFDGAGNLFLTDDFNEAIRRIDAVTGTITTIAGNNGCGLSGIGGPALQASFCAPADLFIDSGGNLFFADSATRHIFEITGFSPISSIKGSFSDFGLVSVGTTSLPQTVTINNTGSATLNITNLATTGPFSAALTCKPASVAPMQSCGVQAFFNPAVPGPQLGTVSFTTNDPAHPSYNFNLSGTGFAGPTVEVSPSSLTFGNAIVSTTTPAQTVTITNTGIETSVSISSIAISGANSASFGQTNNCPISPVLLTPGNNCQIFVTFTPLALGLDSASLVITDSQGVQMNSQQSVSLTGTGTDVPVVASTTYNITGNPFTTFSGSAACPPFCNVAGSFSLPSPLAPNLVNATITPASFSFTVGTANLNQANTTSASFTNVSTDASGSITSWSISLSNASFSIMTNNIPDDVADIFTIVTPQGSASNADSPATWPKTVVTPLMFAASNTPVSNVAVVNCPSGTVPCTDPNAHSLKLTVPQVSTGFTLTVTSYEVPLSQANGVCEAGKTEATDFDCRFVTYFPIQVQANGNVIVPQCNPYSNGNCIVYRVGNTPATTAYQSPVTEYIAWNNNSFVPPAIYQANNPRLYDDPEDPPYNLNHQFVFDITNYYQPTGETVGVDAGIVGQTLHFNDFVVAYPGVPPAGAAHYTYTWLPPLKGGNKPTVFAMGASIPVRFRLSPNTPAGVATTPPNHVGYGVLLDTGHTGCTDFTGVRQTVLTQPSAQTNFIYDPQHLEYDLKLAGIYKPGNYKLLINTGLTAEQCSPFIVTPN